MGLFYNIIFFRKPYILSDLLFIKTYT